MFSLRSGGGGSPEPWKKQVISLGSSWGTKHLLDSKLSQAEKEVRGEKQLVPMLPSCQTGYSTCLWFKDGGET